MKHLPALLARSCGLLLLTLLASCGGSDGPVAAVTLDGRQITVEASLWWDAFPRTVGPGLANECDPLTVTGVFLGSPPPVPDGFQAITVSVYRSDSLIWSGDIANAQSQLGPGGVLTAVAKGCAPPGLTPRESLGALFKVNYRGENYYLRAPAAELFVTF